MQCWWREQNGADGEGAMRGENGKGRETETEKKEKAKAKEKSARESEAWSAAGLTVLLDVVRKDKMENKKWERKTCENEKNRNTER